MFQEIYASFKLFSVNSYLNLLSRYQIREDIVEMYRVCVRVMMQTPELRQRTKGDTDFWFKRAFHFGEKAKVVDPHKRVVEKCDDILEGINILESFYSNISNISILLMLIFGLSSVFAYLYNGVISSSILLIPCLILFLLKIVLLFYQKMLFTDTEMLQTINKNLILNIKDLNNVRGQKANLISAHIWNHSLCDYNTVLFLFGLLILKATLRPVYNQALYHIKRDFSKYSPTYLKNKDKKALWKYLKARMLHK